MNRAAARLLPWRRSWALSDCGGSVARKRCERILAGCPDLVRTTSGIGSSARPRAIPAVPLIRCAVRSNSVFLVSQALAGQADRQQDAARLAHVARQWERSGLLLPPLGTGLISASGRSAAETGLAGDMTRVVAVLSAQDGDIPAAGEPARAVTAVTALLLAGAEPLRHTEKIAVVFGRAGDHGQDLGQEPGAAGFLELCEFPAGPAGLFPDPRSMAGARAMGPEFADSLAVAWRYCRGDRCVLWRITLTDDQLRVPVIDGSSLGAPFALGLLELLRYRDSRRSPLAPGRRVIYRLRPGAAVTGRIDDQGGLHRVGDMEAKVRAAHQKRWLLIVPEENRADLRQAPDPRLVKSAATMEQASRYAHQWRAGGLAATAAALAVVLTVTTALVVHANAQTARQRDIAIAENLASTSENIGAANPVLARLLAVAAWRLSSSDLAARRARQAMLDAAAIPTARFFDSGLGSISSVAFSPDGRFVAVDSDKNGIWLWNPVTGQPIRTLRASRLNFGAAMAFSPDGKVLAASGDDGTDGQVQLWNMATATAEPIRTMLVSSPRLGSAILVNTVTSVAFSPDGVLLATGTENGQIRVWNTASGQLLRILPGSRAESVNSVAFSPDGQTLASGTENGRIQLWNTATGRLIRALRGTGHAMVNSVAFSPDSEILAAGCDDGLHLWNTATGQPVRSTRPASSAGSIDSVAFGPGGRTFVSGGADGIRLWNTANGQPVGAPLSSDAVVFSVAFSPDGRSLVSGNGGGEVRLWHLGVIEPTRVIPPPVSNRGPVDTVAFSPSGTMLATGDQDTEGADGQIRLWNIMTGQPIRTMLDSRDNPVNTVAFSPDGQTLASDDAGRVRLWSTATGEPIRTMPGSPTGEVTSVAFSPDGKTLAISDASNDGAVQLRSTATGKLIGTEPTSPSSSVMSVAFSPDGQTLAAGTTDGSVQLWYIATGQQIVTPLPVTSSAGGVTSVAFSPDGQTLAASGGEGQVQLWNTATGQLASTLLPAGSAGQVMTVAFSPDGKTLAAGTTNGQIQLWNTATGQQIGTPLDTGSTGPVYSVAFSPDGKTLAAGDHDGSAQLWDVSYLENVTSYLCALAGRSLTREEWTQYVSSGHAYLQACP